MAFPRMGDARMEGSVTFSGLARSGVSGTLDTAARERVRRSDVPGPSVNGGAGAADAEMESGKGDMNLRIFGWSYAVTAVSLVVALLYGGWEGLILCAVLGIMEVSLSFDNAVVNATVWTDGPVLAAAS